MPTKPLDTPKILLDLVRPDAVARCGSMSRSMSQEVGHDVDWEQLLNLAYQSGLAPLAYHTLRHVPAQSLDGTPLSRFQFTYNLTARKNAQAYAQLRPVLAEFAAFGIEPIVLKGAALAELAYKDIGLRPFADMDILVKTSDLDAAHEALTALGYRLNYKGGPIAPPSQADTKFRSGRQYFCAQQGKLSIDLYWRLGRYPYLVPLDYEGMWERVSRVTLAEMPARVLSPEDSLVHLALDYTLDMWYGQPGLMSIRDIAQITHTYAVDWDRLLDSQGHPALRAPLYYTLALGKTLLGADVSEEVLRRVYPQHGRREDRLATRLERYTLTRKRPIQHAFLVVLVRLMGPEALGDKLGWLTSLLLPPRGLWGSVPSSLGRLLANPGKQP